MEPMRKEGKKRKVEKAGKAKERCRKRCGKARKGLERHGTIRIGGKVEKVGENVGNDGEVGNVGQMGKLGNGGKDRESGE